MKRIQHHWELDVFKLSREAANRFYELSKTFPREETYALTDQGRRASRSVSAQIAEAWRRRKYENIFVNKLNEAEGEAAETQVWIMYAVDCGFISRTEGKAIHKVYNRVIGKLVIMGNKPQVWLLQKRPTPME